MECSEEVGFKILPAVQAVEMADYLPVFKWLPFGLPHGIKLLLEYTFAVSAALALVNMAPIYGLDGEAALKALMSFSRPGSHRGQLGGKRGRAWGLGHRLMSRLIICTGTTMFGLLLLLHCLRLTGYDAGLLRTIAALRHLLTFTVQWG